MTAAPLEFDPDSPLGAAGQFLEHLVRERGGSVVQVNAGPAGSSLAAVDDEPALDLDAVREALAGYQSPPGQNYGWLNLWSAPSKRSYSFDTTAPGWLDAAVDRVRDLDAQGEHSIYHQGTTNRDPVPANKRGTNDSARMRLRVQFDLDYGKPGYAPDARTVIGIVLSFASTQPTTLIDSGHGVYPVWELAPPVHKSGDVRQLVEDMAAQLREAFAAHGYELDSTIGVDDARLWRIPGTVNRKPDYDEPAMCRLLVGRGVTYKFGELRDATPRTTPATPSSAGTSDMPQLKAAPGFFTDDRRRRFTDEQAHNFIRPHLDELRASRDGNVNGRLNTWLRTAVHFVPNFGTLEELEQRMLEELRGLPHYRGDDDKNRGVLRSVWQAQSTGRDRAQCWVAERVTEPAAGNVHSGPETGPQINGEPRTGQGEGEDTGGMAAGRLPLQSFAALAAEVDAMGEPRWLIEGIWPDGDYGVLAAESKAQKTWTALDLAVSVAAGLDWLGTIPTRRQGPVIVFIGEGGKRNTVRRIRATAEHRDVDPGPLAIYICARAPHLGNEHHMAEFAAMVESIRPALVIVDPLYLAAAGGDLKDLYAMGGLLEKPQHICQAYGANLQLVHHFNRKAGAVGRERMSGAGPAEWGRVLISGDVESRHTDPATKATTVVTMLDVVGGEIAEQTWRVERRIWSDDPTDLGSPLHLTVAATDVTNADTTAAPAGPKLSPAEAKLLEALSPDEPRSITDIVDRIAATHGHGLKRPTVSTGLNRLRELELADCNEPETKFAPKLWHARNAPSPVSASPVSAPVSGADTRDDTGSPDKTAGRPAVSSVSDTEALTRGVSSVSAAYIGADSADTGMKAAAEPSAEVCQRCQRPHLEPLIAGRCRGCAYPAGDAPEIEESS